MSILYFFPFQFSQMSKYHIKKKNTKKTGIPMTKVNQLYAQKYLKRNFLNRDFKKILTLLKYTFPFFYISSENYEEAASSTITINSKEKLLKILLVLQPPARVPHNSKYLGWERLQWSNTNTFDTASTPSLCRGACAYPFVNWRLF